MRTFGQLLFTLGILLIIFGFLVPTSQHVGYMPSSPYLPAMPSDVVNLQGLHIQALVFQGGFTGLIVGAILEGFGQINETLNRNTETASEVAAPEPSASEEASAGGEYSSQEADPDEPAVSPKAIGVAIGVAALIIALLVILSGHGSGDQPAPSANAAAASNAMNAAMEDMNATVREAEDAANAAEAAATRSIQRRRR